MPLQSHLLSDDLRLKACLVDDAAHVTPGAVGDHVSKIQSALFIVNDANISEDELGSGTYGPSTAAAVLDFKVSRNILGPGQLQPDNIVGKKTIEALDAEMFVKENSPVSLDVALGAISWINPRPNPIHSVQEGISLNPNWIPKAALGFIALSNATPPTTLDLKDFKNGKDFRAMVFSAVHIEIDSVTDAVRATLSDSFAESGFTPAFSIAKLKENGVQFGFGDETALTSQIPAAMQTGFIQGETSTVSAVMTGARHPNTAIPGVPENQIVIVNALVKFRANALEDAIGVSPDPGVPFHIPWVWCELLVTYAGQRRLNIFGRGSTYPSHAWYLDGQVVDRVTQSCDTSFPLLPGGQLINESAIILTSFFRKGAPASGSQTLLAAEANLQGSVEQHPNTVAGGATINRIVVL